MKYVVLETIPVKGCIKGAVVESTDYKGVDFSDTKFFELQSFGKYPDRTQVVYNGLLCEVLGSKQNALKTRVYKLQNVFQSGRFDNVAEASLTAPTFFHFINSDGQVCRDFEERLTLKKASLEWRKASGNYFETSADANEMKKAILVAAIGAK